MSVIVIFSILIVSPLQYVIAPEKLLVPTLKCSFQSIYQENKLESKSVSPSQIVKKKYWEKTWPILCRLFAFTEVFSSRIFELVELNFNFKCQECFKLWICRQVDMVVWANLVPQAFIVFAFYSCESNSVRNYEPLQIESLFDQFIYLCWDYSQDLRSNVYW